MPRSASAQRHIVSATDVAGNPISVAYCATITHHTGGSPRTVFVLPEQRHRIVRQYGHEEGWTVTFQALLELPDELLLSWAYSRLRECVAKDKHREFDEIALRVIISNEDVTNL